MTVTYDPNNVFARILRGEEPCTRVYDDDFALAFEGKNKLAPVHVLVIPKGPFVDLGDFLVRATDAELMGFWRGVAKTIEALNISRPGYNLFSSIGRDHNQSVFHFHVHLTSGKTLKQILSDRSAAP